ncbi:hypothetical protein ASZ90_005213 [hydrocarbon metagenome]|uniref:Uncharacterized protein n=1 Tax=hydrocarbon metagenome TaxID=938273 RepID=A0A0W8FVM2_9ZZZZ
MKKYLISFLLLFVLTLSSSAQDADVEVFVIDSYITQVEPYNFILSFFTDDSVTSTVTIENQYSFVVSDTLAEDHQIEIDLSNMTLDSAYVKFIISGKTKNGVNYISDQFEVIAPFKNLLQSDKDPSLLTMCCFGGIIFGLPSPTVVFQNGETMFSLAKEISLFTHYSGGYNYPAGYFGIEYAHIFNTEHQNFLRFGYKQIFTLKHIEFVSAGVSGFTSFKGFNGVSTEITIGWLKIYNAFTLYSRYRYNFQPSNFDRNFHEISIGLYSHFFSLNL